MNLIPQGSRLLIQPCDAVDRTKSGILLPEVSQKLPTRGKVLAIGPGDFADQEGVRLEEFQWPDGVPVVPPVGSTVYFTKYGGTEVKVDGRDLVILAVADVLAIVEGEE